MDYDGLIPLQQKGSERKEKEKGAGYLRNRDLAQAPR